MLVDFYDEMNQLMNDILDNRIKSQETEIRIKRLKETYGDDVFPGFAFRPESKPWDKDYLAKLKMMSITGACSEQFIMHMSEVSDFVYEKKKKKKLLCGLLVGAATILIIVSCAIFAGKQQEEKELIDGKVSVQADYLGECDSENLITSMEVNLGGICYGNFDQC